MKLIRTPQGHEKTLAQRIEEFRAELNAWIDAEAAAIAKSTPGVPVASVRLSLTRGLRCTCAAALLIANEKEDA